MVLPMLRCVLTLTLGLMAVPLWADCTGTNLITALPDSQMAALRAQADAQPYATGNLWRATKGGAEVTLVGTFHLDDPRHLATVAALEPSMARATVLLVEAGPKEEMAIQTLMGREPGRMMILSGPTLAEQMPAADWARLAMALKARGMAPGLAAKFQPWFLTAMLAIPACAFAETAAVQGLDKRLMTRAAALGLPVQGLEPFDTIFGIFDAFSAADQLKMLLQTLDADGSSSDMAVTLSDAYFAGQSRLFWEFSKLQLQGQPGMTKAEADREFALVDQAMISKRNASWIPVIEAAAGKGPVIVAFGALHLSGGEGVLALLEARGWTVRALPPVP